MNDNYQIIESIDTSQYDAVHAAVIMRGRGILREGESLTDVYVRVVNTLVGKDAAMNSGVVDASFARRIVDFTESKAIAYSTPLLMNVGREPGATLGACTVENPLSASNIFEGRSFEKRSSEMLDAGLGTGYDLSKSEDPIATLLAMNEKLTRIDQMLVAKKRRPSASMITLRADHPQIMEFIRSKRNFDFSTCRFNVSVFVTEALFVAAKAEDPWALRDSKGQIVKKISAVGLLEEIAETAHYCGEPGILFKDRFDNDNPTPKWPYISVAPCAELAMAEGDVCHFSYINLLALVKINDGEKYFDFEALGQVVQDLTRLLDAAVEISTESDLIRGSAVAERRRLGVGVTGFASMLMSLDIAYGSDRSVDLGARISESLDYHSKVASVELAHSRGPFPAFSSSRYLDAGWMQRKMPNSTGIISAHAWQSLFEAIGEFGIRNASTSAFPPTGTSSQIAGVSTSIEPYYALFQSKYVNFEGSKPLCVSEEVRGAIARLCSRSAPFALTDVMCQLLLPGNDVANNLGPHFATARSISSSAHVAIVSAFQGFADDAVSKTINLPYSSSPADVLEMLWQSYENGLRGMTVFRDGCLEERDLDHVEEVAS